MARICRYCAKSEVKFWGNTDVCKACFKSRMIAARRRNQKAKPHYIYALVDPRDSRIRYVGKTIDPETRLSAHMASPLQGDSPLKSKWIMRLREEGLRPLMVLIEKATYDTIDMREGHWIETLYACGAPLLNDKYLINGGNGQRQKAIDELKAEFPHLF